MSARFDIMSARAGLYTRAHPHRLFLDYKRENGLSLKSLRDPDPIPRICGIFVVAPIRRLGKGRFEFAFQFHKDSLPAAIIEAFGSDGETTIDLVAWPLDRPAEVLTMFGAAVMLNVASVGQAATYAFGPLRVWRTPLKWLQESGKGVALVDPKAARHELFAATQMGTVSGEDHEHSAQLARLTSSLFDARRFVAPRAFKLQDVA